MKICQFSDTVDTVLTKWLKYQRVLWMDGWMDRFQLTESRKINFQLPPVIFTGVKFGEKYSRSSLFNDAVD
jgi:hypothetical protein